VLADVGQGLLDHSVGGQIGGDRERTYRAVNAFVDGQAGAVEGSQQVGKTGQSRDRFNG
jgi:hypothetical protein